MKKLIIFAALLLTSSSLANQDCLTYRQARKIWPRSHLYWHGPEHCWDNHSRKRHRDPVFGRKAMAQQTTRLRTFAIKIVSADQYNEIDAQADLSVFERTEQANAWPRIWRLPLEFRPWDQRVAGSFEQGVK